MSIEAMKKALEVFEDFVDDPRAQKEINQAITTLRQQIALEKKAENERELGIQMQPVKMVAYNCKCGKTMKFESEHGVIVPKREWVGLTDEEIQEIALEVPMDAVRITEAKLKEKNNG